MNRISGSRKNCGLRFTALAVAFVFTVTSVTWDTPVQAASVEAATTAAFAMDKLTIPAEMGTITREFGIQRTENGQGKVLSDIRFPVAVSRNDKTVILIQDAHAVIDAQENIAKILGHLRKNYGVSLTALEGAKGRLEPILLRTFPDPSAKRKILSGYEKRAELSGPEMAAVLQEESGEFRGMEDWGLYEKNYRAYLGAKEKQGALLAQWNSVKQTVDRERALVYDPKLNEFQEIRENFLVERASLLDLLVYLSNFQNLLKTASGYQELPGLITSIGYERSGRQDALAPLVRKIADEFKTKYLRGFGVKTEMNFYNRYQAFMTGQITAGQMLQYLVQVGNEHGKAVKLTPALKKLLGHAELLSEIKGSRLYDELQRFLPEVEASLLKTPAQREIADQYQKLFLLKEMIALELTHEDLAKYQKDPEAYLRLMTDREFEQDLAPAQEFYRAALERDRAFMGKIDSMMDEAKQKNVAVVAGGFHTQGLERILKEKGVAYAVVTPKIDSLAGVENYVKVMKGDVSFKEYIKTTYFDALMRHATKALVEALPLPDRVRTLKLWRDNVIRELAREGRITDAGKFLPYLDEILQSMPEAAEALGPKRTKEEILEIVHKELEKFKKDSLERIWKTFEFQLGIFTDGLKKLVSKKDLNVRSVSVLLDRASQTKPSFLAPQCALDPGSVPVVRPGVTGVDLVTPVAVPSPAIQLPAGELVEIKPVVRSEARTGKQEILAPPSLENFKVVAQIKEGIWKLRDPATGLLWYLKYSPDHEDPNDEFRGYRLADAMGVNIPPWAEISSSKISSLRKDNVPEDVKDGWDEFLRDAGVGASNTYKVRVLLVRDAETLTESELAGRGNDSGIEAILALIALTQAHDFDLDSNIAAPVIGGVKRYVLYDMASAGMSRVQGPVPLPTSFIFDVLSRQGIDGAKILRAIEKAKSHRLEVSGLDPNVADRIIAIFNEQKEKARGILARAIEKLLGAKRFWTDLDLAFENVTPDQCIRYLRGEEPAELGRVFKEFIDRSEMAPEKIREYFLTQDASVRARLIKNRNVINVVSRMLPWAEEKRDKLLEKLDKQIEVLKGLKFDDTEVAKRGAALIASLERSESVAAEVFSAPEAFPTESVLEPSLAAGSARSEARTLPSVSKSRKGLWAGMLGLTAVVLFDAQFVLAKYWSAKNSGGVDLKNISFVIGEDAISRNVAMGGIYVANANPLDKKEGWLNGFVRVSGVDINPYNSNSRNWAMAKAIFLLNGKTREIKILPAEGFNPSDYPPDQWTDGFQAGPMVMTDGVLNPNLGIWHTSFLEGRKVLIGVNKRGELYTLDLSGLDIFGKTGLTTSGFIGEAEKWATQNGIIHAMAVDGGSRGFEWAHNTPPTALMVNVRDTGIPSLDRGGFIGSLGSWLLNAPIRAPELVKSIQRELIALGYVIGKENLSKDDWVDGNFGSLTEKALREELSKRAKQERQAFEAKSKALKDMKLPPVTYRRVITDTTAAGPVAVGSGLVEFLDPVKRARAEIIRMALDAEQASRGYAQRDRIQFASDRILNAIENIYPGLTDAEKAGLHNLVLISLSLESQMGHWKIQRNAAGEPVLIAVGDSQIELATLGDFVQNYLLFPQNKRVADEISRELGLKDAAELQAAWKTILKASGGDEKLARNEMGKAIAAAMFDPKYGPEGNTRLMTIFAMLMYVRGGAVLEDYSDPSMIDFSDGIDEAYDRYYRKGKAGEPTSPVRLGDAHKALSRFWETPGGVRSRRDLKPRIIPETSPVPRTMARRSEARSEARDLNLKRGPLSKTEEEIKNTLFRRLREGSITEEDADAISNTLVRYRPDGLEYLKELGVLGEDEVTVLKWRSDDPAHAVDAVAQFGDFNGKIKTLLAGYDRYSLRQRNILLKRLVPASAVEDAKSKGVPESTVFYAMSHQLGAFIDLYPGGLDFVQKNADEEILTPAMAWFIWVRYKSRAGDVEAGKEFVKNSRAREKSITEAWEDWLGPLDLIQPFEARSEMRSELRLVDSPLVVLTGASVLEIIEMARKNPDAVPAKLRRRAENKRVGIEKIIGERAAVLEHELQKYETSKELVRYLRSDDFERFMTEKFGEFGDTSSVVARIRAFLNDVQLGVDVGVDGFVDTGRSIISSDLIAKIKEIAVLNDALSTRAKEHAISVVTNHSGQDSAVILDMLRLLTLDRLIVLHRKEQKLGRAWNFVPLKDIVYDMDRPARTAEKQAQKALVSSDANTVALWTDDLKVGDIGIYTVVAEIGRLSDPRLKLLAAAAIRHIFLKYAAASKEERQEMMTHPDLILTDLNKMGFGSVIRFKGNALVFDMQRFADMFTASQSIEQAA